ncbi:DNA-binding transcriptional LysR family regulator [Kibdelosporangium banguiense]|uniref:DNA-binding transcriptional LysR family regulator n=1 Tax=Kibdelosporangium banguiense TaxID=1365924 RepID=A0ABS4TPB7_9PSEU|nr:LysR family transcriptional regulator [Kibdelosporangium banguiense]MBP2326241.1 DNA-binding transcriptional LysR family regulator [Kibdelosporangium banguiense]
MELEVRHLRAICTIAETGSLTRAAAALQQTQPGLSAQLRRIESMLGGQLFERRKHGVVLTSFGELIVSRAQAVLPTVDELMNTLALRPNGLAHRLRIGAVSGPLLAGLVTAIRRHYPEADLTTRGHAASEPLIDDIAAGRLEAALVGENPGYQLSRPAGVLLRTIVDEPVFALLPATHPLAVKDEVTLAELVEEDWATPSPQDRTPEYWMRVLLDTGRLPRVRYEAEGRMLAELVRHGHAISLCQATFVETPGLAVRAIAGDPLWFRHMLAWHQDGPLAAHGETLAQDLAKFYIDAFVPNDAYRRWRARRNQG